MEETNNGNREISIKAQTLWSKAKISLENYNNYLDLKQDRFHLTLIDLLFISNFKGGNATIQEETSKIDEKLKAIEKDFGSISLQNLDSKQLDKLIDIINDVIALSKKEETEIDGFKSSYISALLHAYFPNLIPILDRRLLINLNLVFNKDQLDTQRQVKQIETFYGDLIRKFYELSDNQKKSIRELDKEFFAYELPEWARKSDDKNE
jgi:hypothetical protein